MAVNSTQPSFINDPDESYDILSNVTDSINDSTITSITNSTSSFVWPDLSFVIQVDASCHLPTFLELWRHYYNPVTLCMFVAYLTFALLFTFFGYKCFKATLFLSGFLPVSICIYTILISKKEESAAASEYVLAMHTILSLAICGGCLFGSLTMLVKRVGLLMLGIYTGILTALTLLAVVNTAYTDIWEPIYSFFTPYSSSIATSDSDILRPWLLVSILFLVGLTLGFLNICIQKHVTILNSSILGSAMLITCLDYFIEGGLLIRTLWFRASHPFIFKSSITVDEGVRADGFEVLFSDLVNEVGGGGQGRGAAVSSVQHLISTSTTSSQVVEVNNENEVVVSQNINEGKEENGNPDLCGFSIIILCSWPLILFLGLLTQYCMDCCRIRRKMAGNDENSKDQGCHNLIKDEQHQGQGQYGGRRRKRYSSILDSSQKYRYLYQVRTCNGDVVSRHIPNKYVVNHLQTHSDTIQSRASQKSSSIINEDSVTATTSSCGEFSSIQKKSNNII